MSFIAGVLIGILTGTVATSLIAYQWHVAIRDEVYEQGRQHERELRMKPPDAIGMVKVVYASGDEYRFNTKGDENA